LEEIRAVRTKEAPLQVLLPVVPPLVLLPVVPPLVVPLLLEVLLLLPQQLPHPPPPLPLQLMPLPLVPTTPPPVQPLVV